MTPLQAEWHQNHKRFHAEIARRASLLKPREERAYVIPQMPRRPQPPLIYRMWCDDLIAEAQRQCGKSTVHEIIQQTALHFGISRANLMKGDRLKEFVRPRHIAFYLATRLTKNSTIEIARRFGGFDHSSIIHARDKIAHLIERDATIAADINAIVRSIPGAAL